MPMLQITTDTRFTILCGVFLVRHAHVRKSILPATPRIKLSGSRSLRKLITAYIESIQIVPAHCRMSLVLFILVLYVQNQFVSICRVYYSNVIFFGSCRRLDHNIVALRKIVRNACIFFANRK